MAHITWTAKRIRQKAREVWGTRYQLNQITADGVNQYLTVGCRRHGSFKKRVRLFLQGSGCPACSGNYVRSSETLDKMSKALKGIPKGPSPTAMSLDEVKARINKHHNSKYGLQFVKDPLSTHFTLVCSTHGKFTKRRQDILHKKKTGCPNCNGGKQLTPKEFIARVKAKQPKWITYKKTVYAGPKNSVTITCKYHGDLEAEPYKLLYSKEAYGCTECNKQRIREKRIASGRYPDPEKSNAYKIYRMDVRRYTNQAYKQYRKPTTIRSRSVHIDHMFSINEGFHRGVPAEIVGHITNLRMLGATANREKQTSCSKSLKDLYRDYRRFEKQKRQTANNSGAN